MTSINSSSESNSSSTCTLGTRETLNTENLLNCTYPYSFLNNLLEEKVKQKRYTQHDIFKFVEEYLNIDLKNTFNCIKKEDCYTENYNLLLTSIFSCVAGLLINDCQDKVLIQKVIDTMAESFMEIVDMYCSFNINKKFYDKYFNINNNSKSIKKEMEEKNKIDKNDILDNFLEESVDNINNNTFYEINEKDNLKNKDIINNSKINKSEDYNIYENKEDVKNKEKTNNIYNDSSSISSVFSDKNVNEKYNKVTDKVQKEKKKCPEKNKKDKVEDIYEKIKNAENIYIEKEYNNDIINNIKDIKLKKIDKYMLMIELYENLLSNEIIEPKQFTKYIKSHNINEFFLLNDGKSRRLYNKCKKLYIIKDYIKINLLCNLKIIDKIFSLKDNEFNNLILKIN